jgi:hypothetical protein
VPGFILYSNEAPCNVLSYLNQMVILQSGTAARKCIERSEKQNLYQNGYKYNF